MQRICPDVTHAASSRGLTTKTLRSTTATLCRAEVSRQTLSTKMSPNATQKGKGSGRECGPISGSDSSAKESTWQRTVPSSANGTLVRVRASSTKIPCSHRAEASGAASSKRLSTQALARPPESSAVSTGCLSLCPTRSLSSSCAMALMTCTRQKCENEGRLAKQPSVRPLRLGHTTNETTSAKTLGTLSWRPESF
jgi:hypothetical protein